MKRRRRNPWFGLGANAFALGMEASAVIGLRTLKIAAGGKAGEAEARRMVTEKIEAGMALQAMALTGALGTGSGAASKAIRHYRRKVRANRRRLTGG